MGWLWKGLPPMLLSPGEGGREPLSRVWTDARTQLFSSRVDSAFPHKVVRVLAGAGSPWPRAPLLRVSSCSTFSSEAPAEPTFNPGSAEKGLRWLLRWKARQRGSAARGLAGPGTLMTLSGPLSPRLCVGAQTNLPPPGEPGELRLTLLGERKGPGDTGLAPGMGPVAKPKLRPGPGVGSRLVGQTWSLVPGPSATSPTGSPLRYPRTEEGTKAATPGVPFLKSRL